MANYCYHHIAIYSRKCQAPIFKHKQSFRGLVYNWVDKNNLLLKQSLALRALRSTLPERKGLAARRPTRASSRVDLPNPEGTMSLVSSRAPCTR